MCEENLRQFKFIYAFNLMVLIYILPSVSIAQVARGITRVVPVRSNVIQHGEYIIKNEGSDFIKVHFKEMKLPKKVYVEVSNLNGTEVYRYDGKSNNKSTFSKEDIANNKKSFSAMSITGDTAVVRIVGNRGLINHISHKLQIDYFIEGDFDRLKPESTNGGPQSENVCGDNVYTDVACFENTHPEAVERSRPVAKLVFSSGVMCTAWRLGANNHMVTNNHCAYSQDNLGGAEIWFNYQKTTCGNETATTPVKVTANQLIRTNDDFDFTLFSVNDFASIQSFGHLGLDVRSPELAEPLYIPNHGGGHPKYLSIESDMDATGYCRVVNPIVDGFIMGSDVGYYCDTSGGASGSPVLAANTNRVIALHHLGTGSKCTRSGVKVNAIWPLITDIFNNVVPSGSEQEPAPQVPNNQLPHADFTYDCEGFSCNFDASSSFDPDGEIVWYSWGSPQYSKTYIDRDYQYNVEAMLVVMDNKGALNSVVKTLTFTPSNYAPTAYFSVTCENENCSILNNTSQDPDGSIILYQWDFGDGTIKEGAELRLPSHTYSSSGYFEIWLTVTDNKGKTVRSKKSVKVSHSSISNRAPRAIYSAYCNDKSCTFNNSSYDQDDDSITQYFWDFGDGQTSQEISPTHVFSEYGSYIVLLRVVDEFDHQNVVQKIVNVTESIGSNERPQSQFTYECYELNCQFTQMGSDSDGEIIAYLWDFGDGQVSSQPNPNYTYSQEGIYEVSLTVFDERWAPSYITQEIQVSNQAAEVKIEYIGVRISGATPELRDLQADFYARIPAGYAGSSKAGFVIVINSTEEQFNSVEGFEYRILNSDSSILYDWTAFNSPMIRFYNYELQNIMGYNIEGKIVGTLFNKDSAGIGKYLTNQQEYFVEIAAVRGGQRDENSVKSQKFKVINKSHSTLFKAGNCDFGMNGDSWYRVTENDKIALSTLSANGVYSQVCDLSGDGVMSSEDGLIIDQVISIEINPFVLPILTFERGDCNADGVIDDSDLVMLEKAIQGVVPYSKLLCDCDNNEVVDMEDYTHIIENACAK